MAPGTEFARDFCAGIGPLQLGVVLVSSSICISYAYPWFTITTVKVNFLSFMFLTSALQKIELRSNHSSELLQRKSKLSGKWFYFQNNYIAHS